MTNPNDLVDCRLCLQAGIQKQFTRKGLSGHLKAHPGSSKKLYVETFGDESEFDFDFPHTRTDEWIRSKSRVIHEVNRKRKEGLGGAVDILNESTQEHLSAEEKQFFTEFVEQVQQQTDRDDTQMPIILSLAYDMIYVKRLRTSQLKRKTISDEYVSKDFEKVLTDTESRISKAMTALGISRESQLKRGQIIKSSPACIVSGYLDELEKCTPEVLDAMKAEEQRLYAKVSDRIEKYLLSQAPDITKEDEADAELDRELSFEEAVARAGMALGGSTAAPVLTEGPDLPF